MPRLALLAALLLAGSCGAPPAAPERARNVILFIGDGFGMNHLTLGLAHAEEFGAGPLALAELAEAGHAGFALPAPYGHLVTDSAASASQMATGQPTLPGALSIDARTGEPVETIMEWAARRGIATGLVSNMNLTHATPAAFTVHSTSRYNPEPGLADQLFDEPRVDVLLGGGGRVLVPEGSRVSDHVPGIAPETDGDSRRTDGRNLVAEAREAGYAIAGNREELEAVAGAGKLLGIFASGHLPYVLDRSWDGLDDATPSLADLTGAALASLAPAEGGFLLVVEGGRIDYAGHDNDAGAMLAEILDFDEAIRVAAAFARERDDTLILATADHGTGGFSFTYAAGPPAPVPDGVEWDYAAAFRGPDLADPGRLALVGAARRSLVETLRELDRPVAAPELGDALEGATGIRLTEAETADLAAQLNEDSPAPRDFPEFYPDSSSVPTALVARKLARHTLVAWSTGGHTSEPVPLIGYGPGSEGVLGIGPNTRVFGIVRDALGGE